MLGKLTVVQYYVKVATINGAVVRNCLARVICAAY